MYEIHEVIILSVSVPTYYNLEICVIILPYEKKILLCREPLKVTIFFQLFIKI